MSVTPTPTGSATPSTIAPGDANCDHVVTAADLPTLLLRIDSPELPVCGSDINGDGSVDQEDVERLIEVLFKE